ncbi:putative bifunctional diguanylate cyclase/phosphodiesterase [Kineosporia babensis]|uniref:EAL domain-containing protein n=1 Tax=Kineosporia babensis TaxID=499548 RepID=A0A9X1SYJ8_9ACTN|nr:EAL domain-containing protein [Kineosporia babensis]MCD5311083.1 EAL domain-containing protein [Kineosporia babensis]
MSDEPDLHRVLRRQLRRLKLGRDQAVAPEQLERLLELVSTTYQEADNDRYLLERSLEVSSTEMRQLHESATRKALMDELTGLPNRRALLERLEHLVASQGPDGPTVAVLFIDLDGFKLVNDSLGHDAGDELLVTTAQRLRTVCRTDDVVARLGGDEFIVAGSFVAADQAQALAERIAHALEAPLTIKQRKVAISASIGWTLSGVQDLAAGPGTDAILQRADLAMYASKNGGKARISAFDHRMQQVVDGKMRIVSQLRSAIADDELALHYQPVMDLNRRQIVGAEAGVRWQPPGSAILTTADLVPIAEEYRIIGDLDAWVLREACRRASLWRPGAGGISVNMSVQTFDSIDVVALVRETLAKSDLLADQLVLELTEDSFLADSPAVMDNLAGVRELGVRLAMDHFGSGQSALSRLRTAPVQVLKLHDTLTESVDQHEASAAIAGAAVTLGHALGHLVVAEGVRRRAQAEVLRALGCDAAQGPLFGLSGQPEVLDSLFAAANPQPIVRS